MWFRTGINNALSILLILCNCIFLMLRCVAKTPEINMLYQNDVTQREVKEIS